MITPGEGGGEQPPQIITPDQARTQLPQPGDTLTVVEKYNTHEVDVGPKQEGNLNTADGSPEDTEKIIEPAEGEQTDNEETSEDEKQPAQTQEELEAVARDKKKQELKQLTPEQREANIQALLSEFSENIASASSYALAKEELIKELREQGMTDVRITGEVSRMDRLFDELRDSAEETIDEMEQEGTITPEQAQEKKSKIKEYFEMGLAATGDWVKEGIKSSDSKTLFDLFLVFGAEGRFGTSGVGEFSRGLEKDSSNAYLMEILEKRGEKGLKAFIEAVLGKIDVGPLSDDNIKKLFSDMNEMMEVGNWDNVQTRLSLFLNNNDRPNDHKFDKKQIALMIDTLDGKSADQIRKTFGISTLETSSEAEEASDDSDQANTNSTQSNDQVA